MYYYVKHILLYTSNLVRLKFIFIILNYFGGLLWRPLDFCIWRWFYQMKWLQTLLQITVWLSYSPTFDLFIHIQDVTISFMLMTELLAWFQSFSIKRSNSWPFSSIQCLTSQPAVTHFHRVPEAEGHLDKAIVHLKHTQTEPSRSWQHSTVRIFSKTHKGI